MSKPQTQESEFEARREHAHHTLELINALKQRVEQLVERYYLHTDSSSENSVKLLSMLLEELREVAANTVASAARDIEESNRSLLPVISRDPNKLLLSAIDALNTADLEDFVLDNFSLEEYGSIREVYKKIRKAIQALKVKAKHTPEEIERLFSEAKNRYYTDNRQNLSNFRDDCDDRHDDREILNARYQDNRAVQIWLHNDKDVCKTISEMEQTGCVECELSDLFAYIVRTEILRELAKNPLAASNIVVPPTDEKVKSALEDVLPLIGSSRQWYCIYKPLVQVGKIVKGDFKGFEKLITQLLGKSYDINIRDLCSKMDVGSFNTCEVSKWNEDDAPVTGRNFTNYQTIATTFLELLTK